MSDRSVLITGATGIMGSWVLGEALARGYRPVVLMRDANPQRARERLTAVLRLNGHETRLDDVRILQGDTRSPNLGQSSAEIASLRASLGGMIHCAACTSFGSDSDQELWETNVGGVKNVLAFLEGTGVPLYYVSTAYIAGRRRGRVLETELYRNQEFNNTYERSKCEAERLVRASMAAGRLQASIFRPGIIVGCTDQGRITQFLNFYSFLRLLDIIAARRKRESGPVRIAANPLGTKNLIPVDWTAKALWQIVEADGASGHTYHLTNPKPVSHASLLDWANKILCSKGMRFEFVDEVGADANGLEEACRAAFSHYSPYLQGEPRFDRANTDRALGDSLPFPEIGPDLYVRLLSFAKGQRWRGIFGCKTAEVCAPKDATIAPFPLAGKAPALASIDPSLELAVAQCP
ncbi:MAG: Linear gramicidin synthase subunit D [Verrucomicrobia bacterium ADurb.Bin345]|nr:MAG: Linear gramicidin synthase subunit D [Verrucomicrobia bacterium ADurb.Bin345]